MKSDDEGGVADLVFKNLVEEPSLYLVPDWEEPEECQQVIRDVWPALFEAMLMGWVTDPDLWPSSRTLPVFHEWFELEFFGVVEDICSDGTIP